MKIQAVRGMQDLLPAQKKISRTIEDVVREVLAAYGYREIGLPQLEQTELFKRVVGENTDIVEKEMYTFDDRNGESLTLRPEGTAGCVRFAEQNGLLFNQVQRLWYSGAMFRYERPQKGRYRQFDQIGAECFGMPGPDVDAELLLMNARIWRKLGLDGDIRLELNSLGNPDARVKFKEKLAGYLQAYEQDLDEDSQRRLTTNPLRILDSKSSKTQEILRGAPVLSDFMDNESKQHFEGLRGLLDDNGIAYAVNPNIVRGLDYYNKTVFEWITTTLGSQGTVCGGGRYDGLVEQLGGKPSPGVGFAMGLDRLSLMLAEKMESSKDADVYVVSQGNAARATALRLAESIRDQLSGKRVVVHCGDGKFKSQMKKADASGADLALVLGEDEVAAGTVSIKSLREGGEQSTISQETLAQYCLDYFSKEN
ncbi:MAG: histidine--tRNA ligase [Gammaproteobacteria bacterium]|jgi:histidyl-tRNA synthetase|nr:histidine--tRNA ligase [Gammaproteobacteria bacterium]MBT3868629.1 histidine--tRNA ligase [Gammaproteobacteria bacterium]MBT4380335.1 histidine--tRNA ligase [Gammaproteobacteria bacterium]MBT5196515.1 histidine--tRNA ligase [Gammaproteobacteria bacterium]MBT5442723.1 histidine--tRNA ligase [Gammaproteobacteria bacterium]